MIMIFIHHDAIRLELTMVHFTASGLFAFWSNGWLIFIDTMEIRVQNKLFDF